MEWASWKEGFGAFRFPAVLFFEVRSAIYKSPFFGWWSKSSLNSSYTPPVPSEFCWTSSLVKLDRSFLGLFTLLHGISASP
ncbi:hypothetical protein GQ457_03G005220 [Hibiscus cannabinus]